MIPLKLRNVGRPAAAVFGAVLLGVCLLPCRSLAWGKTWLGTNLEQIVNAARWKIGPFRSNAVFRLGNAGYDSDLYFGQSSNPVPDTTFMVGPELSVYVPLVKGIIFDLLEIPQYMFFLQNEKERALNNVFRGRFHFAFEKLYFMVGGGLINAKERLSTELNFNIRRKENDFGGLAFWQISEGSAVTLQYRSISYEYENPPDLRIDIRRSLNRNERLLNLTAYLMQISRARVFLDAEYGSYVSTEALSSLQDSRSYGITGGIEFDPLSPGGDLITGIQGRINLGYKRFDIPGSQRKIYNGFVANTSVGINLFKFTALHGQFTRNLQFSLYSDLGYYIKTGFGAGLTQALARKINFTYEISFSRNDYVQIEDGVSPEAKPDNYFTHTIGLDFRLGKNFGLNLMANLGERSSKFVEPVHRRYFLGFNLTYGSSNGAPSGASRVSR